MLIHCFIFFLSCVHPILFGMKVHTIVFFCFALFSFVPHWSVFVTFFFFSYFFKHIINHTKFVHLHSIRSSVYIGMRFHLYIFFTTLCLCFLTVLNWSPAVVFQHFSQSHKQGWFTRWLPCSFTNPTVYDAVPPFVYTDRLLCRFALIFNDIRFT